MAASLAFSAWQMHPALIAALLAPLLFAFAWAYYHLLLRPLASRNHFEGTVGTVLVTVGTLMILSDLTAKAAGATQRNIPLRLPALEFGEIVVSSTQMLILGGIVLISCLAPLRLIAHINNVPYKEVEPPTMLPSVSSLIAVVPGTPLLEPTVAGAAGLYVLSFPVDPYMGFGLTVKAFTIIVVGGIGNLPGALLAGVFLGVAEGLTGLYWKPEWAPALSVGRTA